MCCNTFVKVILLLLLVGKGKTFSFIGMGLTDVAAVFYFSISTASSFPFRQLQGKAITKPGLHN